MTQNADNISIVRPVVDGAAWCADASAATPSGATAELTGFTSLGWLSEDGITMTISKETQDLKGFGGDTALTIQTSHDVEFKFKPMEWNEKVAAEMFGESNVTGSGEAVKVTGDDLPSRKYVFDMRGRNKELIRVVVPNCKVTAIGEMPFKHNEPMAAEFTLKAFPDADGVKVYIYKATASI